MKISTRGQKYIRDKERYVRKAYLCPAGVWTVGYGHTGPEVVKGYTRTREEAETDFQADIAKAETAMRKVIRVAVSQSEWDALVSLTFNIGPDAFRRSTVLRRLNAHDDAGAGAGFDLFIKVRNPKTGKLVTSNGLVTRRAEEKAIFMAGATENDEHVGTMPQAVHEAQPIKEVRESMTESQTVQASATGGTSLGASAIIEPIQNAQDQLSPMVDYLEVAKWAFLALGLASFLAVVYFRYRDMKRGRR